LEQIRLEVYFMGAIGKHLHKLEALLILQ
jgi:hypothetical protein